jgi:uncharacterized protein DUF6335
MKKRRPGKKPQPADRRSRSRPKAPSNRGGRRSREPQLGIAASELLRELSEYTSVSPADTGGDVDADWQRAQSSGEEAVGGSVATPDQDIVDQLARPLGVERPLNAPVITSEEILSSRDRRRWRIEQHAEEQAREADEA